MRRYPSFFLVVALPVLPAAEPMPYYTSDPWGGESVQRPSEPPHAFRPSWYLAMELLPSSFRSTVESRNGTFQAWDTAPNYGIAVGRRWPFIAEGKSHGLVLGLEGAIENASFAGGTQRDAELRAIGDWAFSLGPTSAVHTGLRAGVGMGLLDLRVENGSDVDSDGQGWSLEPHVDVHYQVAERWELALGAGWHWSTYAYTADDLHITLVNQGFAFRLGVEWLAE